MGDAHMLQAGVDAMSVLNDFGHITNQALNSAGSFVHA